MSSYQKNYDWGRGQAMRGVPFSADLAKYPGYEEGWDAGNEERPIPMIDELLSKRRRNTRPTCAHLLRATRK